MLLMALTCTAFADWPDHQVIHDTTGTEVARSVVLDVDSTTPPHGYFAFDAWVPGTPGQGTLYASRWDGATFTSREVISTHISTGYPYLPSIAVRDVDTGDGNLYVSALFTSTGDLRAIEEWVIVRASLSGSVTKYQQDIGDQTADAVPHFIGRKGIAAAETLTYPQVGACYVADCDAVAYPQTCVNEEDTFGKVRSDTGVWAPGPDTATADLIAVGNNKQEHCVTSFEVHPEVTPTTPPPTQVVAWTDVNSLKVRTSDGDANWAGSGTHNLEFPSIAVVTFSGGAEAVVLAYVDIDTSGSPTVYTLKASYCVPFADNCGSAANWTSGYGADLSWGIQKQHPQIAVDPDGNLFLSYLDMNGGYVDRMMVKAYCYRGGVGSGWETATVVDTGTAYKDQAQGVDNSGGPMYDGIAYGNIVYDGGTMGSNTGFVHVAYLRDDGVGGTLWKPVVATELVSNLCPP